MAFAASLALGGAAACTGTSSGSSGGSHGSGNSDPGCIPGLPDTCKTQPPQAGGGQPIPSADAANLSTPEGAPDFEIGDCSIDLFPNGVGLTPGAGLVLGLGHHFCNVQPWSVKTVVWIQSCTQAICGDNDWRDEPQSFVIDNRLPPLYPEYNLLHTDADCVPGRYYRIAIKVSGLDAVVVDGKKGPGTPFATDEHPIEKFGPAVRYSTSECTGK